MLTVVDFLPGARRIRLQFYVNKCPCLTPWFQIQFLVLKVNSVAGHKVSMIFFLIYPH